jgi:hypothetical protein
MNEQALAKMNATGKQISSIIEECLPATTGNAVDFIGSLVIAKGVHDLKTIFLQSPEIQRVVMSMCNNRLGFLTDRTPAIVARNQRNGKYPQKLYSYQELVDPLIEGLLKGYRINNNEINIIAGQFYAAKNGNYRLIMEYPGLANFAYNNAPAVYTSDHKSARVKVWATWRLNDVTQSIGVEANDELVLAIRVNFGMGDDAVLGKAHAKLFKRVLERLSGQVVPESSDVDVVNGNDLIVEHPTQPKPVPAEAPAQTSIYGDVTPAKPDNGEAAPQLREKFSQLVAKHLSEQHVDLALENMRSAMAEKGLTETEFMLKILNFPQACETFIGELSKQLIADEPTAEEPTPAEEPTAEAAAVPAAAEPESQKDNFWHHKPNWVNRRATPFLMLVRVGCALPFETGVLGKQNGDSIEITESDRTVYNQELKKHPDAWGALLTAHASVKVCVMKKITEKRSMGLADGIFDQWLTEAQAQSQSPNPESLAADTAPIHEQPAMTV